MESKTNSKSNILVVRTNYTKTNYKAFGMNWKIKRKVIQQMPLKTRELFFVRWANETAFPGRTTL